MKLVKAILDVIKGKLAKRKSVIEITTKIGCPVLCAYCPQEKLISVYAKASNIVYLSWEVFKRCIDKIPSSVDIIFGGMCEPFLNPECAKMILYAHQKKHTICVDTTLRGMNIGDIEVFKNIPFKYFNLHLPSDAGLERIEIDDRYFALLERIGNSGIKILYHFHGKDVHPKVKPLIKGRVFFSHSSTRAGNIEFKGSVFPVRKKGVIRCGRNLRWNVLLPNGDVILCSSDYGMQHKLGNLLNGNYGSLFKNKEFKKLKKCLNKDSEDILCRYCDAYAYEQERLLRRCIKILRRNENLA